MDQDKKNLRSFLSEFVQSTLERRDPRRFGHGWPLLDAGSFNDPANHLVRNTNPLADNTERIAAAAQFDNAGITILGHSAIIAHMFTSMSTKL